MATYIEMQKLYNAKLIEVRDQIGKLEYRIDQHETAPGTKNYADIGDLAEVSAKLQEILEFLGDAA